MEILGLLVIVALAVGAFVVFVGRAHTVVKMAGGQASLVRGNPPPGLLGDLRGVAKMSPDASGRVELRGQGATLKITTPGLSEGQQQRVRNVVLLHKSRIQAR